MSPQESVLPAGVSATAGPEGKDESDLLLDGEVDALFHSGERKAFTEGHPQVKRLFKDPQATERDYFARTGILPIRHAVATRNDLIDAHPWLPEAVFKRATPSMSKSNPLSCPSGRTETFVALERVAQPPLLHRSSPLTR